MRKALPAEDAAVFYMEQRTILQNLLLGLNTMIFQTSVSRGSQWVPICHTLPIALKSTP